MSREKDLIERRREISILEAQILEVKQHIDYLEKSLAESQEMLDRYHFGEGDEDMVAAIKGSISQTQNRLDDAYIEYNNLTDRLAVLKRPFFRD